MMMDLVVVMVMMNLADGQWVVVATEARCRVGLADGCYGDEAAAKRWG